ncbi:hypothetical protein JTB14_000596 [Gonioctena quinquepunctata]|nr:hypothetical protein JTB14_000596 [Gonioctena quinquepunctata]
MELERLAGGSPGLINSDDAHSILPSTSFIPDKMCLIDNNCDDSAPTAESGRSPNEFDSSDNESEFNFATENAKDVFVETNHSSSNSNQHLGLQLGEWAFVIFSEKDPILLNPAKYYNKSPTRKVIAISRGHRLRI